MKEVRKIYTSKGNASAWQLVSDPSLDRDNDRVFAIHPDGGISTGNWMKAGAPLFANHDYALANMIGRAVDARVSHSGLEIRPEWRQPVNDYDPMSVILPVIESGLAKAFSIGFIPKSWNDNVEGGRDITACEILEVSVVGIGANPNALSTLSIKGARATLSRRRVRDLYADVLERVSDELRFARTYTDDQVVWSEVAEQLVEAGAALQRRGFF